MLASILHSPPPFNQINSIFNSTFSKREREILLTPIPPRKHIGAKKRYRRRRRSLYEKLRRTVHCTLGIGIQGFLAWRKSTLQYPPTVEYSDASQEANLSSVQVDRLARLLVTGEVTREPVLASRDIIYSYSQSEDMKTLQAVFLNSRKPEQKPEQSQPMAAGSDAPSPGCVPETEKKRGWLPWREWLASLSAAGKLIVQHGQELYEHYCKRYARRCFGRDQTAHNGAKFFRGLLRKFHITFREGLAAINAYFSTVSQDCQPMGVGTFAQYPETIKFYVPPPPPPQPSVDQVQEDLDTLESDFNTWKSNTEKPDESEHKNLLAQLEAVREPYQRHFNLRRKLQQRHVSFRDWLKGHHPDLVTVQVECIQYASRITDYNSKVKQYQENHDRLAGKIENLSPG